jgi:DNA-binding CsgD family transcriptional regulator
MSTTSEQERRRTIAALIGAIPNLSPAELRVCLLVLEEKSTKEIAGELGVSIRTVQNQRYSIRRKLGGGENLLIELMKVRGY